jgi:hypothetical protein
MLLHLMSTSFGIVFGHAPPAYALLSFAAPEALPHSLKNNCYYDEDYDIL